MNLDFVFEKKLILTLEFSYMLRIANKEYSVGIENDINTFPKGWFIGALRGYQFPFLWIKDK